MDSTVILRECDRRGIKLRLDGAALRFEAGEGAMTDSLLGLIRAHKPSIIAAIAAGTVQSTPAIGANSPVNSPVESSTGLLDVPSDLPIKQVQNHLHTKEKKENSPHSPVLEGVDTPHVRENKHAEGGVTSEGGEGLGGEISGEGVLLYPHPTGLCGLQSGQSLSGQDFTVSPKVEYIALNAGLSAAEPTPTGLLEADLPLAVAPFAALLGAPSRPTPWREVVRCWPMDAREKWGRLAGELQDTGRGMINWRDAELIAFEQMNDGPIRPDQLVTARRQAAKDHERELEEESRFGLPDFDAAFTVASFREAVEDTARRSAEAESRRSSARSAKSSAPGLFGDSEAGKRTGTAKRGAT